MSGPLKKFYDAKNMYLFIKNEELLIKYNKIWNKAESNMRKKGNDINNMTNTWRLK